MTEPDAAVMNQPQYRALVLSTRPIQARGDDHVTKFASGCLHDMTRQVRDGYVWLSVEHLSVLPPLGRWRDAQVELCEDGEEELFFTGEDLPHYVGDFDDSALQRVIAGLPISSAPTIAPELHYDRRNYDWATALEIEQECDCPAHGHERWAELPPLEFALAIPVVWGATRFAGAFLDELGRAAGQALASKIRSWAGKCKDPNRSQVFVVVFRLDEHTTLRGCVVVPPSDPENLLQRAWNSVEALATVAGLQADRDFLPGMVDSAFFFDGDRWQLGWWTDGERVIETTWLRDNPPDTNGILGRPLFRESD
jgi:hypothetical protein